METMEPDRTTDSISLHVVEALAATADTDPLDLEPPLYDVIDPEALDRLFRPGNGCRVTFTYDGHAVDVRADGTVTVDGKRYDER